MPQEKLDLLPEMFLEQVKQVLEHLYDFPYLQRHPLAYAMASGSTTPEIAGQRLRHEVIEAIETLNPDKNLFFREPQARLYNLLYFYYVEGLEIDDVASEMGLSRRQVYRDLKQGQIRVAEMIWSARQMQETPQQVRSSISDLSSVRAEVARLKLDKQTLNLAALVQNAHVALARLATDRMVTLDIDIPPDTPAITTDASIALQILVDVLSHAINQAQSGTIRLTAPPQAGGASLEIHFADHDTRPHTYPRRPVVMALMAQLKWRAGNCQKGMRLIRLDMVTRHNVVLMIDDNEALTELVDRYLTSHDCQVVTALSGETGWALAQRLAPDAIILDVMMPDMDGWELLQRLQSHPLTAEVPVIICSVFSNPELAYSLGADYFLSKPVKQEDILACLHQIGVV